MRLGEWMCPGNNLFDFSSGTEAACPPMREHIVIRRLALHRIHYNTLLIYSFIECAKEIRPLYFILYIVLNYCSDMKGL